MKKKSRNFIARDLFSLKYKKRIVKSKKGKGKAKTNKAKSKGKGKKKTKTRIEQPRSAVGNVEITNGKQPRRH